MRISRVLNGQVLYIQYLVKYAFDHSEERVDGRGGCHRIVRYFPLDGLRSVERPSKTDTHHRTIRLLVGSGKRPVERNPHSQRSSRRRLTQSQKNLLGDMLSQGDMNSSAILLIALIGVVILTVCLYNQNSGWDYFRSQSQDMTCSVSRLGEGKRCPPGYRCYDPPGLSEGTCVKISPPVTCSMHKPCPPGYRCWVLPDSTHGEGKCFKIPEPCSKDSDCKSGRCCKCAGICIGDPPERCYCPP